MSRNYLDRKGWKGELFILPFIDQLYGKLHGLHKAFHVPLLVSLACMQDQLKFYLLHRCLSGSKR
jgi:hypothetical protein